MGDGPARCRTRTIVERDVEVPMADGTVLALDVHRPDTDRPVGCLLQRVPYGKDVPAIVTGALDPTRALERGYAVAIQDCRGRGRSDGCFVPFVHEAQDGADTVRWIASQPWCDGAVGMFGRSYAGVCQWLVAARDDVPALRAVAPMFSGSDPWRGWMAPGGVEEWGFAVLWSVRYLAPELVARRVRAGRPTPIGPDELRDWIGDLDATFSSGVDGTDDRLARLGEILGLVDTVLGPDRSSQCSHRPADDQPASTVPALVIGGWYDILLRGTLETWSRLTAAPDAPPARLVVGPWAHGGTCPGTFPEHDFGPDASADAVGLTALQLDWFDRWMSTSRDPSTDGDRGADVFVTGSDEWRSVASWPPGDVTASRWYLTPGHESASLDGYLLCRPVETTGAWQLDWDESTPVPTLGGQTFLPGLDVAANAGPRDQYSLLGRGDVLAFVSGEARSEAIEIAGTPVAVLSVSGAPPGARWCVRLVDVGVDSWTLLAEGAARSTGTDPSVTVRLPDVAHTIAAGHRVATVISHTSYPRFGRWISDPHDGPAQRGATFVHHGPDTASWLDLPIHRPLAARS